MTRAEADKIYVQIAGLSLRFRDQMLTLLGFAKWEVLSDTAQYVLESGDPDLFGSLGVCRLSQRLKDSIPTPSKFYSVVQAAHRVPLFLLYYGQTYGAVIPDPNPSWISEGFSDD